MFIRVKEGVTLDGLQHHMLRVLLAACYVYSKHGIEQVWITSAVRMSRGKGSLHPSGRALDLRRWGLRDPAAAAAELAGWLGPDYDVVLEVDHIHVEHDPPARPPAGGA